MLTLSYNKKRDSIFDKRDYIGLSEFINLFDTNPLWFQPLFTFTSDLIECGVGEDDFSDLEYRHKNSDVLEMYYNSYDKYPELSFCNYTKRRYFGQNLHPYDIHFHIECSEIPKKISEFTFTCRKQEYLNYSVSKAGNIVNKLNNYNINRNSSETSHSISMLARNKNYQQSRKITGRRNSNPRPHMKITLQTSNKHLLVDYPISEASLNYSRTSPNLIGIQHAVQTFELQEI